MGLSSLVAGSADGASALITTSWVREENRRPGTRDWTVGRPAAPGTLEGYLSAASATLGDTVELFVSAPGPTIAIKVYRLGFYQGLGARLVESRHAVAVSPQPIPAPDSQGTVDCDWPTTARLSLLVDYPPGQYLIRLEDRAGGFRFVPLLVRDDASRATYLYQSAVTTWQAYNTWGGYSLYRHTDPTGTVPQSSARAVRVSFNRPYQALFANGAADLIGNELPMLMLTESLGLDLAYGTDLDLHTAGGSLANHRTLVSLGHDEYWSVEMRDALVSALAAGTNAAFFGANFCYRKVRFEPDRQGRPRLMVNYRSTADPIMATDPAQATVNWSQWPSDQPESLISGSSYGGVDGVGSLHVSDATTWLWRGTGLRSGAILAGALADEFNNFNPSRPHPHPVQILAHSPVAGGVSDVTYMAGPGGAGVFSSGTGHWVNALTDAPRLGRHLHPAIPGVTAPLRQATLNVLSLFGQGPAGTLYPSR